jgi:hypothetical protein
MPEHLLNIPCRPIVTNRLAIGKPTQHGVYSVIKAPQEYLSEALLKICAGQHPVGSVARSRAILEILWETLPTAAMRTAYFENLERMLEKQPDIPAPGQIVLGLGAGRCGSTSLTALMASVEGSCSTHENPPAIYWEPMEEQIQFHIARLKLLANFFPLVFDAAHWWLNPLETFFSHFPEAKVIGLHRDEDACVRSFMKIKGLGPGSLNHWAPPGNAIWKSNNWDPTYPTYQLPMHSQKNSDDAKKEMIGRYVRDYNSQLTELAGRFPDRVLLVQTEELGKSIVQKKIFDFIGLLGTLMDINLNVGTIGDGLRGYKY